MRIFPLIFGAVLLALPAAVQAEWYEASSENFVVYADDSEKDIRRFSEQLEQYHSAMELVTRLDLAPPSPSNRVTVYVVDGQRDVRRLANTDSRYLQGFYIPRAGGSIAIVPKIQNSRRGEISSSMGTLLHEYAHHFLISNSTMVMPRWMSEGGAEFFASASFESDGSLMVGRPAGHRGGELYHADKVTVEELVDPEVYAENKSKRYDSFYGKSWLLYHYLTFDPERRGQLGAYMRDMAGGLSSREAAIANFGDFDALEKDLDRYLKQRRMTTYDIKPEAFRAPAIEVRRLRAGEEAIMPVRLQSRRGVNSEQAGELLPEAREIATEYGDDPAVLASLAEAEYDAGNDDEAIAAADAALAIDPRNTDALVQKGYALFRKAEDADDYEAAYNAAFKPFQALNAIENDHPIPLMYFYRSFTERGEEPTELAVVGLERATELSGFDLGLRMTLAMQMIRAQEWEKARRHLAPVAYNPHGNSQSSYARRMIEAIENASEDELADGSWRAGITEDGGEDADEEMGDGQTDDTEEGEPDGAEA